jgi:hypothetical protein
VPGNQIDTFTVTDDSADQIAPLEVAVRDQPYGAVDLRTLVSGTADDLLTHFFDENLHLLADPERSTLADELLRQICHPRSPGFDFLGHVLPIHLARLRTFLRGVAEDSNRI